MTKQDGKAASTDTASRIGEDLRRRAEKIDRENSARTPKTAANLSAEDVGVMLYELQVHQIELEMQNEELRLAQQHLEDSRTRYFELYNLAPIGYLTINEKGLISEANLTFSALVDVSVSTLIKQPFSQFIFREDQDVYYLWRKLILETKMTRECEIRMVKRGGALLWARLLAKLAKEVDGTVVIRIVVNDITEPKKIEKELAAANLKIEEASKSKSIFLANMSHELRTPLNTVIGFSEVLQDKLFGPLNDKQTTFVENILGSGRHLLSLINDILDISKVEASKMTLDLGRINLTELCKGTVAAFSEKARKEQIDLSYMIDSSMDGEAVVADGRKIKQILYNLVDNGIKFNRPYGSVTIQVQKVSDTSEAQAVQIVVKDTGIGIADEDLEKLFLPFSQLAQECYDRQTEGTGLGLALTKQLVELHGGTISLRSERGKGCRFTVLLPINQE